MKKLPLIISILILLFSACKTSKQVSAPVYEPAVEVAEVEEAEPAEEIVEPEPIPEVKPEPEPEIVMKTEEVTVEKDAEQKVFPYYVIVGSFSVAKNANNLQAALIANGEMAEVLKTESGLLRVALLGTNSESEARNKIGKIRKGTEYDDAWLLKTK